MPAVIVIGVLVWPEHIEIEFELKVKVGAVVTVAVTWVLGLAQLLWIFQLYK